ncbi:MAG: 30S ribosomal protein S20 [Phycisphaerae bacterium]
MAHSISAKKRIRQNAKRAAMNRARHSRLRSQLRKTRDALTTGNAGDAEKAFKEVVQLLDRESNRGLIHPNAAARRKSRLARRLNAVKAQPPAKK